MTRADKKRVRSAPELRRFRGVVDRFLEEWFTLFPQDASALGLTKFDAELGRNDPRTHRLYVRLLEETLAEVEAISELPFRGDDWLDRRLLLSMLRTGLHSHGVLERWRNNPQIHCDAAVNAIFDLAVRHAGNLRKTQPVIESRLARLPDFLREGASCVARPIPLWTKLAIQTCDGAALFLDGLEKELVPLSPEPAKTGKLFAGARAAFTDYARSIAGKEPGAAGGFAVGREGFEFLIREKLGLPWSLREAEAMGLHLIAQLSAAVKKEAARFGRKPAHEIIADAAAKWRPATGSLLAEYQMVTADVRARFAAADLLTLPANEKLHVMPVPPFLRHQFPTAAYHSPGPFARDQSGIFWVNDLSAMRGTASTQQAEVRQHFGLELTCAHEGYPGHHVQFVIQNRHPSPLRRLASHAIFYEGWTLWCEKMCIEQGINPSPHARLMQLHDALWRAHRIVIDCGLHSRTLSLAAARRNLVDGVHFTPARAQGDVNWYTSAPTVPMSYLLGRLELEKLHAHLSSRRGWTIKQFNDWALSFGAIPWSWIWQAEAQTA